MQDRAKGRIESLLFAAAKSDPSSPAIVSGERTFSYADIASRTASYASKLHESGLQAGNRVGVYLDKTPECVIAIYAIWAAGGILVPINEKLHAAQVQHILRDAGCRILVSSQRKIRAVGEEYLEGSTVLEVELDPVREAVALDREFEGFNEPAAILYTSGSSGRPKGILISHYNLLAGARIVSGYLGLTAQDRILSVLPFSFDYGLNQLLVAANTGAACILQRSTLPAHVCATLSDQRISVLPGVPPFWVQLQQDGSPFPDIAFPWLRILTNTGGAFPPALVARYRAQLPKAQVFLMYGLSEAFRSSFLDPAEVSSRPGSMGKAIPETTLFLINERGEECAPEEVGEIVHDGPTVALGYWRNESATARVFREHPFDTDGRKVVYSGDLARRDVHGYFYFVARNDQMIKSMGYRISPDDVEEQIYGSGMVAEVVIGGVDDEMAGQVLAAHVVPADSSSFQLDDLRSFCRRELPSYLVPREIHVHASLPRTSSGKLDRQAVLSDRG